MGEIYILTNPSFPQYVKIGYATDVKQRLDELNRSTAVPFAFRIYATYEVDSALSDKKLHSILDKLNPELRSKEEVDGKRRIREFYAMTPEDAYSILEAIAEINGYRNRLEKWKATANEQRDEALAQEINEQHQERLAPFTFSACGIAIGETIEFYFNGNDNTGALCEVIDDKHVSYNGEIWSLTALAKHLTGVKSAIAGPKYFKYKGEWLNSIRQRFIGNSNVPPERVAIFDEAQRAWTQDMIEKFMATKKGVSPFPYSEPEFLISTMDRHQDWAVVICLVGGGQEINTGEAGLPEWFDSLRKSFPDWDVYITPQLNDDEYRRGRSWSSMISGLNTFEREELHLATSVRSFRTPDLAVFVKAVLDADTDDAKALYQRIKDKYPIVITRDLNKAKAWVRDHCQGTTRYGLLASSGALRLKPEGVFVKNEVSVANWFLNGKDDVRSSYMLEDVVSEFDIQGLELDYSVVAWDADYRYVDGEWTYNNFVGNRWTNVSSDERRLYLKNAYRVLLTRARQGMAIFVPAGSDDDQTRKREWYDGIYGYLKGIGIDAIE